MIITFDKQTHTYAVNGDIAHISVTELLAKHGLSPNYDGVDKATLTDAAEYGKTIHKDIENFVSGVVYEPITPAGEEFAEWARTNLDCAVAEQMLAYEYAKDLVIAGTCDLLGYLKDGTPIMGDHKTTTSLNKESVSWQVSLLDYMARKLGKETVNDRPLNWKGAAKFYCWHYDKKTQEMSVVEIERVPDGEIEKLLEAEFKGERYMRPLLVIDAETALRAEKVEAQLIALKRQEEAAMAEARALREVLCAAFEAQGINSWTSPNGLIKISYVPATTSLQVDGTKLRREQPALFEKYAKCVQKKAYVRVYDRAGGGEQ